MSVSLKNCNRSKSDKVAEIILPFDEFCFNDNLTFTYIPTINDTVRIKIDAENGLENNIKQMHIEEAYEVNNIDVVEELITKAKMYNGARINELITKFKGLDLSEDEIKVMVFGDKIEPSEFSTQSLSKLKSDILKELAISF